MCGKRTNKTLSEFQEFLDSIADNMNELDTRDLSDADLIGDTPLLPNEIARNENEIDKLYRTL